MTTDYWKASAALSMTPDFQSSMRLVGPRLPASGPPAMPSTPVPKSSPRQARDLRPRLRSTPTSYNTTPPSPEAGLKTALPNSPGADFADPASGLTSKANYSNFSVTPANKGVSDDRHARTSAADHCPPPSPPLRRRSPASPTSAPGLSASPRSAPARLRTHRTRRSPSTSLTTASRACCSRSPSMVWRPSRCWLSCPR